MDVPTWFSVWEHLQDLSGCEAVRTLPPFVFTLDRVLTLHRRCRMPIGSLVLALLQHLNYPGCAVTTCDLNRYWGYLGLLGLDGCTKAGEGKGDRLTMIDRCLKWPAAGTCSSQMFSIKREFYRMWRRYLHKTLQALHRFAGFQVLNWIALISSNIYCYTHLMRFWKYQGSCTSESKRSLKCYDLGKSFAEK